MAALALPVVAQTPAGIPGVLAPGSVPELVQEGYVFTEGPVATADGGLYFSDIRVSKTYFLDAGGKISVDRKSTRLNSSHQIISYAVFCLKKKKKNLRFASRRQSECVRLYQRPAAARAPASGA